MMVFQRSRAAEPQPPPSMADMNDDTMDDEPAVEEGDEESKEEEGQEETADDEATQ